MIGWKSQRKRLFHWRAELEKVEDWMGIHLSMQKLRAKFFLKTSREKCTLCPQKRINTTKGSIILMCARRKLQKTALSMVKSRLALISGGCLFVGLSPCRIHRITDVDCPPFSRPEKTMKEEYLVHPVFYAGSTLGLVFIYPSSWYEISCAGFVLEKIFRQHQLVQHLLPVGVHLPHGPGEIKWQMKMTLMTADDKFKRNLISMIIQGGLGLLRFHFSAMMMMITITQAIVFYIPRCIWLSMEGGLMNFLVKGTQGR